LNFIFVYIILFKLDAAEEKVILIFRKGLLGSSQIAQNYKINRKKVISMMNLDMVFYKFI
jgi:hypothetical protein